MKRRIIFYITLLIVILSVQNSALAFTVTSPFGWRNHPITGEWSFHTGLDIAGELGTAIPAIWEGEVVYSGVRGGYGNVVVLKHDGNKFTLYGHCAALYVEVGHKIAQNQVIAAVGNTGNSTGPHVHLELIQNGQYVDPMIIWK